MKIVFIIALLHPIQGQNFDDEQILTTIENAFSTLNQNQSMTTDGFSTSSDLFDETSTFYSTEIVSFSPSIPIFSQQQWFNEYNQSKKDSSKRSLSWIYFRNTSIYVLQSQPQCLAQMCSAKLKYNQTISTRLQGCLAFDLQIRGQPVGQLWISEDNEQENISQKILFTGKTLRIEHSLKSNIRNLSIDSRILFRNPSVDRIFLSNLSINWKGSCPKHRSKTTTRRPPIIIDQSSIFDDFLYTSTFEDSTIFNGDEYPDDDDDYQIDLSTTSRTRLISPTVPSSSVLHESKFLRFLSVITSFCVLLISSSMIYGFWSIRKHSYSLWGAAMDSRIRFLFRRSIRSSNRSNPNIATIAQILDDLDQIDRQQQLEQQDTSNQSFTPSSDQSLANVSYYTYL